MKKSMLHLKYNFANILFFFTMNLYKLNQRL